MVMTSAAHGKRRNRLLLTGETTQLSRVAESLGGLDVRAEVAPWIRVLVEPNYESILVLLVVLPLPRLSVQRALGQFRADESRASIPVVVLAPSRVADRRARQLYRDGATAVLKWPDDAKVLSPILAELLGVTLASGRATSADDKLARTVLSRLRLLGGVFTRLGVTAKGGTVRLSGAVPSLEQKLEADQTAAMIPGVSATDLARLRVRPTERVSDRELGRIMRVLLRAVTRASSKLRVRVRDGLVELSGEAADRRELRRVVELLSKLQGVRGLEVHVDVQNTERISDADLRRRLRARLDAALPDSELRVAVVSGVVILEGRVPRLSSRREAERLVADDAGVTRILNKIAVG
jgi:osmotically-inducible protein OsmY